MLKLAAFADEISPDLDEQIQTCKANGVTHFELRSVNKINVLDFDRNLRSEIHKKLTDNGLGVVAIGSPIGKVKIDDPFEPHFERFKIAVDLAEYFGAGMVRIFSYYPPSNGQDLRSYRDEIMRRMRAKVEYVASRSVVLVHENEKEIYGQNGKDCLDLVKTMDSPKLRAAFDFANFVEVGERPLDNWAMLKPYTIHIHVKDAPIGSKKMVPAGQGDGQIEPILVDAYRSGYRGFLTLEPHLSQAGQFTGFTGPALFKVAVDSLRALCQKNGIPLKMT
jgi:sugar phosphate isomerase/epimerase